MDTDDQASLAEDRHGVQHGPVGNAELCGQVAFAGQLDWILSACDPGDGVGDLLVDVASAGTIYGRVVGSLGSRASGTRLPDASYIQRGCPSADQATGSEGWSSCCLACSRVELKTASGDWPVSAVMRSCRA